MCQIRRSIGRTELRAAYKSNAFGFQISFFVPILTYVHECWVMTERVRSQVHASKKDFLRKVRGLSLLNKVKALIFVNLSTLNDYYSA